jgi:hypothetical protein
MRVRFPGQLQETRSITISANDWETAERLGDGDAATGIERILRSLPNPASTAAWLAQDSAPELQGYRRYFPVVTHGLAVIHDVITICGTAIQIFDQWIETCGRLADVSEKDARALIELIGLELSDMDETQRATVAALLQTPCEPITWTGGVAITQVIASGWMEFNFRPRAELLYTGIFYALAFEAIERALEHARAKAGRKLPAKVRKRIRGLRSKIMALRSATPDLKVLSIQPPIGRPREDAERREFLLEYEKRKAAESKPGDAKREMMAQYGLSLGALDTKLRRARAERRRDGG